MIRKFIVFFLYFSWLCTMASDAQNMKTIFVNLPDSIEPLLTKVNREDCVDFLESNMRAVVKNRFNNSAELKTLTADYLKIQLTAVSVMELKLLPLKDSTSVVCMVKTVCAPTCDSEIRFFDTSWTELDVSDFLQIPSDEMFYQSLDSLKSLQVKPDMLLMEASLSPDNYSLVFENTTLLTMNKEDREKIISYLRKEPVAMEWKEGYFK